MKRPAPCCRWTRVQRPLRCLLRDEPPPPPRRGGAFRSWPPPERIRQKIVKSRSGRCRRLARRWLTRSEREKLWHLPAQIPKHCDGPSRVVEALPGFGSRPSGYLFQVRCGEAGSAALDRLVWCGRRRGGVPPLLGGGSVSGGRFGEPGHGGAGAGGCLARIRSRSVLLVQRWP